MMKIKKLMKRHRALKIGDMLGVCAPSARFDTEKLNSGIQVLKSGIQSESS